VVGNHGWVLCEYIPPPWPFGLHYLASLGPIIAAVVVTCASSGASGLAHLLVANQPLAHWQALVADLENKFFARAVPVYLGIPRACRAAVATATTVRM
jgi:hypothetical protein